MRKEFILTTESEYFELNIEMARFIRRYLGPESEEFAERWGFALLWAEPKEPFIPIQGNGGETLYCACAQCNMYSVNTTPKEFRDLSPEALLPAKFRFEVQFLTNFSRDCPHILRNMRAWADSKNGEAYRAQATRPAGGISDV